MSSNCLTLQIIKIPAGANKSLDKNVKGKPVKEMSTGVFALTYLGGFRSHMYMHAEERPKRTPETHPWFI